MKNYELMQLLSGMPAGGEVKMNLLLTQEDMEKAPDVDKDDKGQPVYSCTGIVQDVDRGTDGAIYLYT